MPTIELLAEIESLKRRLAESEAACAAMRVALEALMGYNAAPALEDLQGYNVAVRDASAALAIDAGRLAAEVLAAAEEECDAEQALEHHISDANFLRKDVARGRRRRAVEAWRKGGGAAITKNIRSSQVDC